MKLYLFDSIIEKYYEIIDKDAFLEGLDDKNFEDIKHLFKMTYQENLLQTSLKFLRDKGYVELSGEPMDLSNTVEMFHEYIIYRYDESIYKKMISSFEYDFDYRMKVTANPSILN